MFTGIVQQAGRVASMTFEGTAGVLKIDAAAWDEALVLGESIAVEGVCLTVTAHRASAPGRVEISFDVLEETFRRTNLSEKPPGALVNLERACRVGDALGGHILSGHVDGVGTIVSIEPTGRDWVVTIGCAPELMQGIVYKGSIAVNGISLTVAGVEDDRFSIYIIPHTWEVTSLHEQQPGERVNLEIDMLGKYVKKYVEAMMRPEPAPREQDAPATIVGGASSSPSAEPGPKPREQDAPATMMWEYFNPMTEIDIRTSGHLPHWEQGSVWYFVTFRLADALPREVVEEMQQQRERWKQTHDLNHLSREELAEYYRLFSERYQNLLNAGSGSCVLREPAIARIVYDALRFFDHQRYDLDEVVVMPNHVHLLVKPLAGHGLTDILHSWKSYTANRINERLGRVGQLWQHESYDHIVRNEAAMNAIRRYIRENPSKAG